jgi:hypothetical protein
VRVFLGRCVSCTQTCLSDILQKPDPPLPATRVPGQLQVAPYELLRSLKSEAVEPAIMEVGGVKVTVEMQ